MATMIRAAALRTFNLPKCCKKIIEDITPTLPSPVEGEGIYL